MYFQEHFSLVPTHTTLGGLRFHSENALNVFRPNYAEKMKKKTRQSNVVLDLCLKKTRAWKSNDYRKIIRLMESSVFVHTITQGRRFEIRPI